MDFFEDHVRYDALYIHITINNKLYKALIDTGSTRCSISISIVENLDIAHMIDRENIIMIAGIIGRRRSLGRIQNYPILIDNKCTMMISFDVINMDDYDLFILGLDFLVKYSCKIDFEANNIIISGYPINFLNTMEIEQLSEPVQYVHVAIDEIIAKIKQLEKKNTYIKLITSLYKNIYTYPTEEKYKKINFDSFSIKTDNNPLIIELMHLNKFRKSLLGECIVYEYTGDDVDTLYYTSKQLTD